MKKYTVAQTCTDAIHRLQSLGRADEQAPLKLREAEAMTVAVEARSQLHTREMREKLRTHVREQGNKQTLVIRHGDACMNNRDPLFWCRCFVRLFPMGRLCGEV